MFYDLDIHALQSIITVPFDHETLFDSLKTRMRGPQILRIFFDPVSAPKHTTFTKEYRHVTTHTGGISTDCFIFCDKTLDETRGKPWGFTVEKTSTWLGVGAGLKERVIELRPNWYWQQLGHGAYVFGGNTSRSHQTDSSINDKADGIFFNKGHELVLQYDICNRTLKVKNKYNGDKAELPNVPGNAHIMIVIFSGENEMAIVDQGKTIEEI
jgi:hypothetical protein